MIKKMVAMLLVPFSSLAQNVGIGIAPSKARLEINGAVGITTAIFGGDGAGISFQRNNPGIGFNLYYTDVNRNMSTGSGWVEYLDMVSGSLNFDFYANQPLPDFPTNTPTRRLTISQNGNVAINNGEANATLFVGGANIGLPSAIFRGSQYNSVFYESVGVNLPNRNTYINAGKNGSLVLLNDKLGGNVLFGNGSTRVGINTDPTDVLEVKQYGGRGLALINPNFAYWEFFVEKNLTDNASDLYVYYNGGNLGNFYSGDGKYYYYSDRRLKANIQPLSKVLAGVMALRPCQYEIKYGNPGHIQSIGLIAQEVLPIFPEITGHITGDDLGYPGLTDLYTINYDALGPLAIKAIQEQQQKLAVLNKQVHYLRQRITAAEKALSSRQFPAYNQ